MKPRKALGKYLLGTAMVGIGELSNMKPRKYFRA